MKTKQVVESESVENLLNSALGELESLKDEMREWEERMADSDGLSATAKYEAVSECAELLDEAYETIEDSKGELTTMLTQEQLGHVLEVKYTVPNRKGLPRWARLGYAIAYLDGVREYLKELPRYSGYGPPAEYDQPFIDAVDGLDTDNLGGIEFPGMYG